ncbi:probable serine/threonine-protein kinase fhkE [Trichoplusia ni]|uniref:Probable serine/threonine-protein kinase fhkE n=1 Tax=Trichoplusia ni TaxID=7111 RepID=A0A7E5X5D6_TRINI|nr:probable serine/threonine-protein kinase fhkE [Trichoplusia ni]
MKQYLVLVVLLSVVAHSQCGLIDGLLGTVKDTAHSVTSSVGGALHYGKNMVFGSSETNAEGHTVTKPGIVGRITHKIHDVSDNVRNEIRHIFTITDNDAHGGLLSRALNKVKKLTVDIRDFFFGSQVRIVYKPVRLNNDTNTLCDKLRRYILSKNTGKNSTGLMQTIMSIQDALDRMKKNMSKNSEPKGEEPNYDGTGLLDIRTLPINNNNDEIPFGIHPSSGAFDPALNNVLDTVSKQTQKAESSINSLKQSTNDFLENQKNNLNNNYNRVNDGASKLKGNLDNTLSNVGNYVKTERDKATDEMKNTYNNINSRVKEGGNKMRTNLDNAVNEGAIHFRDETENAANTISSGYKKVDFDENNLLGDIH